MTFIKGKSLSLMYPNPLNKPCSSSAHSYLSEMCSRGRWGSGSSPAGAWANRLWARGTCPVYQQSCTTEWKNFKQSCDTTNQALQYS